MPAGVRWSRAKGRRRLLVAVVLVCLPPAAGEPFGPPVPPELLDETPSRDDIPAPPPSAPEPARPEVVDNRLHVSAERVRTDERRRTLFAEGALRVRWRDWNIAGERALFDFGSDLARLEGPLRAIRDDGLTVETASLDLRLDKDWYTSGAFHALIPASVIERGAVEPFHIWGSDVFGVRDTYFAAHNATFSSCPENDLKYALKAKTIAVVPNRKIILRSAKLELFGVPLLAVGKMVLPLRRYRRTEWLPEVGRNEVYGVFTRMRYFYDLADSQFGNVSGMLTEKRGAFLGVEHDFGYGRGDFRADGRLDFEYGSRRAELSARGNLTQGLGPATRLTVNGTFSQNSGFSTTTSQSNLTGRLDHRFALGTTALGFSRSQTDSGSLSSSFTRLTLDQRFDLGAIFQANLNADYSARASSQPTDEELETKLQLTGRWTLFDWQILDQRRFDLEGSRFAADDNRAVTEIVPQLTLRTDSRRLNLPLPDFLNLRLDTSVGQYREFVTSLTTGEASRSTVLRLNFDVQGDVARLAVGPRLRFLSDVRYSQSFFDHPDPAAKYIVAVGPRVEWSPFDHTRLDLRYRWQEVAGFSPLPRYDFAQTLNDIDFTAAWFVPDPVRPRDGRFALNVNGGFDLLRGRPRDLRLGAQWLPVDALSLNLSTSYSLAGGFGGAGLRSMRGEVVYDGGERYRHEVGFTYDPRTGIWQRVDSLVTCQPFRHLTVQNALTYDGFRKKFTYNDILVNFDMGCLALVGSYRQQVKEFRVDLNVTAFPGLISLFGSGKFGQQFSTSQGFQF